MNLVEVVILVGSQCLSPMQSGPGLTEVNKVSCAVLIRQDPQTAQVEIVPQEAATNPDVVAMLVKPHAVGGAGADAGSTVQEIPVADDEAAGMSAPRAVPKIAETVVKRSAAPQ